MVPHHSLTRAFEIYFTQAWSGLRVRLWLFVYAHLWNRHHTCLALNISVSGVNGWNWRHVQYRESCKERKKKLQAVVWQLLCLFPVLWCHSVCECIWVCPWVSKQCCAYLCVGMYCSCPCPYELRTSVWWERVILQKRAVNNWAIISFPPMTWMYTEHTVTRTWLMGNHTNFQSDFFIFTTDTQLVICYVPLYSHKCGTKRETCNPISFVYYCYYL